VRSFLIFARHWSRESIHDTAASDDARPHDVGDGARRLIQFLETRTRVRRELHRQHPLHWFALATCRLLAYGVAAGTCDFHHRCVRRWQAQFDFRNPSRQDSQFLASIRWCCWRSPSCCRFLVAPRCGRLSRWVRHGPRNCHGVQNAAVRKIAVPTSPRRS